LPKKPRYKVDFQGFRRSKGMKLSCRISEHGTYESTKSYQARIEAEFTKSSYGLSIQKKVTVQGSEIRSSMQISTVATSNLNFDIIFVTTHVVRLKLFRLKLACLWHG
jgi:hypothetical protein